MTTQPPLGLTARATVDRVIDGDTIDVLLTLPVRVRLLNCWSPEVRGPTAAKGVKAKRFVESILAAMPDPPSVVVSIPSGQADALGDVLTFGRVLGDVFVDGQSLAELIIHAGHGTREKGQ